MVRRHLGQRAKFVEAVVRGGKGQHSIVDESRGVWVDKGRRAQMGDTLSTEHQKYDWA